MNERPIEVPGLHSEFALPIIRGLASLHDSVLLLDPRGRILWISERLATRFGGAEKLCGEPWQRLLVEPKQGRLLWEELARTGRLTHRRVAIRSCSATGLQATVSAARLGPDPATCPVVAILRLGEETRDREWVTTLAAVRPVLDTCPDAVVIVDRSRCIAYANPAIEYVTGHRPEDLIDRPVALFVRSGDELEGILAAMGPASAVRDRELHLRRADGSGQIVSVSVSLLRLSDGAPAGAVVYLRDVTERRRQEDRLARKNEELEHYVHAVSHDLRSPLVSMLGFSRLLREDYASRLDDKGRHFLDRVEQAGRTMEGLIHDLLELSRIGRTGERRAVVDPVPILRQLKAELKPRLDRKGIELVLPEDAPHLEFDPTRLYQLLSNLVGNAVDHMGPVEDARVDVEIRSAPDHHLILVRDNGRGIAPEHCERIFEIFHSLTPPGGRRRGTGIGLAVVRKIAEIYGGTAWVESTPGRGATFKVRLPNA